MLRSLVPFSALAVSLFAGATAAAEEADLQSRLLLTAQTYSSVQVGVDGPTPGSQDAAGFVYPAGNVGVRIALGQGSWSADPQVYLGHMADGGDFKSGYTVGIWTRLDSPSPSIDERYGAAHGLSFTHFSQSDQGRLVSNTVEGGIRLSADADGEYSIASGDPLGQAVIGYTFQGLVMDNVLVGPSTELRIGNERAPWGLQLGLRMSI